MVQVRGQIQFTIDRLLAPGPVSLKERIETLDPACPPSLIQLLLDALVERVFRTGCQESAQAIAAFGRVAIPAIGLAFLNNENSLDQARLAAVVEHLAPELDADQQCTLMNELGLWMRLAASPTAKLAVSNAIEELEELMLLLHARDRRHGGL